MADNLIDTIDALLSQPFCTTDRSVAEELEKWQGELAQLRQRLTTVTAELERRLLEESCRQVIAQIQSRLAAANSNLFPVPPQVEYATFELAKTLSALTVAHTFTLIKEHLDQLLSSYRPVSPAIYQDEQLLNWIDQRLAQLKEPTSIAPSQEKADLDRWLTEVAEDWEAQLSFQPPAPTTITTIAVQTIEDKLNDFADRLEISFKIPGAQGAVASPSLPSLSLEDVNDSWFLGIDFGNTAIRLSLSNLTTNRVYDLGSLTGELLIEDTPVRRYKSVLQVGLPYLSNGQWRPLLQWREGQPLPLLALLSGMRGIMQEARYRLHHPNLKSLPLLFQHLSGVVFGYPPQWDDAYIFNLREVILNCGFCQRPEQVIAVPQTIAPLLERLHRGDSITEVTLFIDGGANTTELLLVKPVVGQPLSHEQLFYQSVDQGGENLSMTLVRDFLLPQMPGAVLPDAPPYHPQVQAFLDLADRAKHHLDREDIWLEEWRGYKLSLGRSAYIQRVCQPYVQLLNRQVNSLLIRSGLFADNVKAVVCGGGVMTSRVMQEWVKQKFPQASVAEFSCSANGLAVAPRFYALLDLSQQQYSDFFLLHEICQLDWSQPMHPATVLQQLQQRGINVHACVNRVISILQNNLPKGVIPEDPLVIPDSGIEVFRQGGGLFQRLANGFYQVVPQQLAWLESYLSQLCNNLQQSIREPMVFSPLH
ncbi:MAG: hypothetical protein RMK91_12530 [Pseudanabaenaceae cyanobacterium SKYGB_i_bin29]|nr:hypothetical protein [Pseudanabaenaceae cyanobacterium SKYG29]MDW8422680.1 hypothetical protein [Pseudanabaenaceae cyanobacterium SKYGB_i_bin29]